MRTDAIKQADMCTLYRLLTPQNRAVLRTCLATGLRVGDVLALRTAQLRQRMTVTESKTKKKRQVYLSADLLEELKAQAGSVYVFPGARDPLHRHRCRQAVWKDIKRAARAMRVSECYGTHSARKAYACALYHKTGSVEAVRKALGHDDISTTLIYLASAFLS